MTAADVFRCPVCGAPCTRLYGTTATISLRCSDCLWKLFIAEYWTRPTAGELQSTIASYRQGAENLGRDIDELTRALKLAREHIRGESSHNTPHDLLAIIAEAIDDD